MTYAGVLWLDVDGVLVADVDSLGDGAGHVLAGVTGHRERRLNAQDDAVHFGCGLGDGCV